MGNKCRKMLIVVDMIQGFVNEGALADSGISAIIPENLRLVQSFLKAEADVVFFKDCHSENAPEFDSFPSHCVKGTAQPELVEELKIYEDRCNVFEKNSTNGFFAPGFCEYLENYEPEEVIIVGCCTDICVMNLAIAMKNYFNQENRRVAVIVPANAVETFHIPEVHERNWWNEAAFAFMKQAGVRVADSYPGSEAI